MSRKNLLSSDSFKRYFENFEQAHFTDFLFYCWFGLAGLAASPSYLLFKNPSLALYSFWKCVEVVIFYSNNLMRRPFIPHLS
jgi:hypothetical protein